MQAGRYDERLYNVFCDSVCSTVGGGMKGSTGMVYDHVFPL